MKKSLAKKKVAKGSPARKSVYGDRCWDVQGNTLLGRLDSSGARTVAGVGGSESAVLHGTFAGQWRTNLGVLELLKVTGLE